jgi:predicted dehydrogenase
MIASTDPARDDAPTGSPASRNVSQGKGTDKMTVRFGLVGVNTSHADAFSRIFNGNITDGAAPRLDSGRITAIWGHDLERIDTLSRRHGIDTTVSDPTAMIGAIDAALVVDDTGGGAIHAALARPFIEAGVPVYIDKPMTTHYADAVALFDLAERHGTPIMSCSALRFAPELEAARAEFRRIGRLSSVVSVGPGDWYYYGVHAVEMLGAVAGTGATWVHRHALKERDIAVIGYDGGPVAVVETLRDAAYVFHLTAYGADGWTSVQVSDFDGFYTNTMRAVVQMVETGTAPLSREQTLEVLAILEAGNRSAETGERVALADIQRVSSRDSVGEG